MWYTALLMLEKPQKVGADAPAKQSHSPPSLVHSYKMTALRLERSNQQPYIY